MSQAIIQSNLAASVHLFLAHKGGVGKTTLAAFLAEWFLREGASPVVFDADARNVDACISQYQGLNARRLDSLLIKAADGTERISEVGFEELLQSLCDDEGPHIVDTGANTYTNFMSYMKELDLPGVLSDAEKDIYIHAIIAGGEMTEETVIGVEELMQSVPSAKIILWINEFKSPAVLRSGESLAESKRGKAILKNATGIINLPQVTDIQRDALNALGRARMLAMEVKLDKDISAQKKIAYAGWSRKAFAALDAVFGESK